MTRVAEDWEDYYYKMVLFSDTQNQSPPARLKGAQQSEARDAVPSFRYDYFNWNETDYLLYVNDEISAKSFVRDEIKRGLLQVAVQSGDYIQPQYLGLLDHYEQIDTTNRGAYIDVSFNDNKTVINNVPGATVRFFSQFGAFNVSSIKILTIPGIDLLMKFTASKDLIRN